MRERGLILIAICLFCTVPIHAQVCSTYEGVQRQEFVEPSNLDRAVAGDVDDKCLSVVAMERNQSLVETGAEALIPGIRRKDSPVRSVRFRFYGKTQIVSVPYDLGSFHPSGISENDVDSFMDKLDDMEWGVIVDECMNLKTASHYNDWAVFEWIQSLAMAVFPKNVFSEKSIFTVFLMDKMGLMTRLVRSDKKLTCLYSSKQQVYSKQFIVIDGYPLYVTESFPLADEVYVYKSRTDGHSRSLDMRIIAPVSFGTRSQDITCAHVSSVFNKTITVPVNPEIVSFYNSYPQLDPFVYACSSPASEFNESLMGCIKDELIGINDFDAVNIILSFVQKDFEYKLDIEQFGREKPFFCEENFVYPYCDCEDRCILFSHIVRSLLGLKVLLVDYGEHLATAVNLPKDIKGTFVMYNKTKYYLCDPSYIGACAGMSIPRYNDLPVKLYVL